MNTTDTDWVIIGRFCKPHGIKGLITVRSFTEPHDNILQYSHWYIQQKGQWLPIKRVHEEITHKHILTRIEGYSEREDVAALTNLDIAVSQKTLPELKSDEHYWHQLIGMTVMHRDGSEFGVVRELLATGSNDVLVVVGNRRYLIPYLPGEVVLEVDTVKQVIIVNWDMDF